MPLCETVENEQLFAHRKGPYLTLFPQAVIYLEMKTFLYKQKKVFWRSMLQSIQQPGQGPFASELDTDATPFLPGKAEHRLHPSPNAGWKAFWERKPLSEVN